MLLSGILIVLAVSAAMGALIGVVRQVRAVETALNEALTCGGWDGDLDILYPPLHIGGPFSAEHIVIANDFLRDAPDLYG